MKNVCSIKAKPFPKQLVVANNHILYTASTSNCITCYAYLLVGEIQMNIDICHMHVCDIAALENYVCQENPQIH